MKKIILRIISLAICMILIIGMTVTGVSAAETEYSITQLAGKYKTQGRTFIEDGTLLLDWSASGIEFEALCSGEVKVTFDAVKVPSGDTGGTYFTVIVDGVAQYADLRTPEDTTAANWTGNSAGYPFHITESGEATFTIASGLEYGKHTFEIYKQSEANYDVLGIKSISLIGTVLDAPAEKDLYIEIIGDSIAAGASNLTTGTDGSGSMYQDATQGWPYMTARALGADWSILAKSGIMATEVPNHTSMQTAYQLQRYYGNDATTMYDFKREPDVVVICLGTNDNYHAGGEDIVAGMTQMLELVREKNPNAKIVWVYGMMTQSVNSKIADILETAGGWRKGYYGLLLEQEDTGHPKMDMQYIYTEELTKFITNAVLNPEYQGKTGLSSGDSIIYRATDSMDNVAYDKATDTQTEAPYRSSEDTVWKFGVSGLGDTFKSSAADFAAPVAEKTREGCLKLSWDRPENSFGKTTVKVIGNTYNKEVYVAGTSVIIKDAPLDEKLQAQVTIGDMSSEVLSYYEDPILTSIKITDSNKNETTAIDPNAYLYADLSDVADKINDNTGILIKLESVITRDDIMITHYYDLTGTAFVERSADSPITAFQSPISLNDIGYSFSWKMTPTTVNDDGSYSASSTAYTNNTTDRTRYFYAYDHALADRSLALKNTDQISFGLSSGLYQYFYKSGYILVPFEAFSDSDLEQIKGIGAISLKADTFYYRARIQRNKNGNQDVAYLPYGATTLDPDHTNTANLTGLIDREMHYTEVAFVNDFDAFVAGYVNDTTTTITTPVSSTATAVENITYMEPTASGIDYNLTNASVSSSYLVDYTNLYPTKLTYTTASGEKMKLGFTAIYDGEYQISAPIGAEIAKGVHYRVVRETKGGLKSLLQDEAIYNGEEYFTLLNAVLSAGDTVYLEAWADSAGTQINIGVPQAVYLGENATENTVRYSLNEYLAIDHTNDLGSKSVWRAGTFINPFTVDGVEYQYLRAADYDVGTTYSYDSLGLGLLSATDGSLSDGSKLISAFKEYDGINVYSEGSTNEYFYQTSDGGVRFYDSVGNYSFGSPLRYNNKVGILTVNKVPTNTDVLIRYGFGYSPGGGHSSVYINFGHYQQFISPKSGNAVLDLGGYTNYGKVIVLHNTKVIATYLGGTLPDSENAITVKLNKGDTLSIAYGTIEDEAIGLTYTDTGNVNISAAVYFTPDKMSESSVSFDSTTPVIMKSTYQNGSVITIPTTSKAGAIFRGWKVGNTLYSSGDEYTVSADVDFKADYIYYGDLNGTGEGVKADDISIMRKIILGFDNVENAVNTNIVGDIDANGKIDLIDLVRVKKMAADIDVSVGVQ